MATPESIATAFAKGMMEAMLAQPEVKKEPKHKVVKTDDVQQAVAKYLDQKLAQAEPVQEDLFHTPVVDLGEDVYAAHLANLEAAQQRADKRARDDGEMPDGYFDANQPGQKQWVGP